MIDYRARLGWFINERHSIWQRREAGRPRPWTADQILAGGHFTNIYRELDPGTQLSHALLADVDQEEALWRVVAYRLINRRQTVEEFPYEFTRANAGHWLLYLNSRYAAKKTVSTRRHLTPNRRQYGNALAEVLTLRVPRQPRAAYQALRQLSGVGVFMGWQLCADLVETNHVDFDDDFVVPGDGACFAIAVLADRRSWLDYRHDRLDSTTRVRASDSGVERFAAWVRWLRDTQDEWVPSTFVPWDGKPLSCKTLEHSLCEWARYEIMAVKQ